MGDTDRPELPFTRKQFAEIHKQPAAKDLGFVPFSPLPPGEQPPSMSENWRYAMRRYGRFQGYAWAGVLGAGLLVWGGVKLGSGDDKASTKAVPKPS